MRFFRSRVGERVWAGCVFVSSERGPDEVRRYTIRVAQPDGSIDEGSTFGQFASRSGAARCIERTLAVYAYGETPPSACLVATQYHAVQAVIGLDALVNWVVWS